MSSSGIWPNRLCAISVKGRGALQTPKDNNFIAVLAIVGGKFHSLDMIRLSRDLPVGALYIVNADELGTSDNIHFVFKIRHRPGFADRCILASFGQA